jgi:hypothetical protein
LAPTSFGDDGTRSEISRIIVHFDTDTDVTDCLVSSLVDMSTQAIGESLISFDAIGTKLQSIGTTPKLPHLLFHQLQIEHGTEDEALKICGVDYKVSILDELGIKQASE